MTINIDPTVASWLGSVIAVISIIMVFNTAIEAKKQKTRQARADDMLDRTQQSQERNNALLDREEAMLSRIDEILKRFEDLRTSGEQ